jgi:hypothetical protein
MCAQIEKTGVATSKKSNTSSCHYFHIQYVIPQEVLSVTTINQFIDIITIIQLTYKLH